MKRWLSLLLYAVMLLGLFTVSAQAIPEFIPQRILIISAMAVPSAAWGPARPFPNCYYLVTTYSGISSMTKLTAPQMRQQSSFAGVNFSAVRTMGFSHPMLWAVENGITSGVSKTSFAPDAPCTRGQVVTFLHRAMN